MKQTTLDYHSRLASLLTENAVASLTGNVTPTTLQNFAEIEQLKTAIKKLEELRVNRERSQYGFAAIDLVN
ncbi:hypothetical protein [Coleofasciculus sp. E1-EBD-02]|uniref:hypothetical protein n=1 Tax=Coleofasciculus sp. E1-EBD-02 TaxID=3068481 RepID=UPI0032F158C7